MKAYTFVEPLEPDTISGYSFKVTTIYSSLNKDAIEALLNEFKKDIIVEKLSNMI